MSGGGKPRTGGMSSSLSVEFTEEQATQLQQEVSTLKQSLLAIKQEVKKTSAEFNEAQRKMKQTHQQILLQQVETKNYQ